MKNKSAIVKIIIFMAVLIVPSIAWGIISLCGMKDKLDFDLEEKRDKYTISADADFSKMPAELEAYYNDRVPFRSILITANKKMNTSIEKNYTENIEPIFLGWIDRKNNHNNSNGPSYIEEETSENEKNTEEENDKVHEHSFILVESKESDFENYGYEIHKCSICGEEKRYTLEKLIDTSVYPMKIIGDTTIQGRYNWLFYVNTLSDYEGENIMPDTDYESHLASTIALKKKCDELGKELYFVVLPNKNSVYPEYMPTVTKVAKKRRMELIKEYLDENTDVILKYPIKEMLANKPYYQLYYKYDTHWSPFGFMVGVNAIYEAIGMDKITYDDYEVELVEKYTGDLAVLAGMDLSGYPSDVEGVVVYKKEITTTENELLDSRFIEIDSTSENKKKLVFMGDSFRFGFRAFIAKDFSHTLLIDRVLKGNEEAEKQIKEADVIVIELVERNEILLPEDASYMLGVLNSI